MASKAHEQTYQNLRKEVPPEVLAVSPVPAHVPRVHGERGVSLPLNVLAIIIGYVEDTADIARLTRTCRLMYYMTLPQLYKNVTLRSYAEMRYVDGRPEGYGSGSPFTMALSGLATNNAASLVNDFLATGSWREPRVDDYGRGIIPDSTMLLGIALRAAIDKMINLKSFRWELDMKPVKTVYHGLAGRNSLVSLHLKFPCDRAPRPIVTLPPIPNLRNLRVTNIDPLCYPDDLSVLLLQSKKLEDVRLHWNPRMREEAEPSINLRSYFGKCLEAKYKIPLKHIAFQNFYGVNTGDLKEICDSEKIRGTDFINCFGGTNGGPATIFVDETWKNIPEGYHFRNFKRIRVSEAADQHARILASFSGLEELYFVDSRSSTQNGLPGPIVSTAVSPTSSVCSYPSPNRTMEQANAALCKQYLHVVCSKHGHSMKKLLLSREWALSGSQIAELVSTCPNIEQLGLGLSEDEPNAMRVLAPFLKNVLAIRILSNDWLEKALKTDRELQEHLDLKTPEPFLWKISPNSKIKWSGIGDKVFRIGKAVQIPDEDGRMEWQREVWRATLDDVKHIEIWSEDRMEI